MVDIKFAQFMAIVIFLQIDIDETLFLTLLTNCFNFVSAFLVDASPNESEIVHNLYQFVSQIVIISFDCGLILAQKFFSFCVLAT